MNEVLGLIFQLLGGIWWLIAFFILWPITESAWLFWRQEVYKSELPWTLLEMRIPRETKRNPKAMEQALAAFHQLRNAPGDLGEKYRDGEVTHWFNLEMVSLGGEVHFFMRVDAKKRDLFEAAIFSYYPDIELVEAEEDYVDRFPENVQEMYRQGYDMYGAEMQLVKDPAYPIKSYEDFEAVVEERQYDPISVFLEVLGKVKREEMVGIQFLCAPAGPEWKQNGEKVVEQLSEMKRSPVGAPKALTKTEFPGGPLPAFSVETKAPADQGNQFRSLLRSPGQTDVLKAVENNLSKPGFECTIRFVYFSPKATFYDSFARRGIVGSFNQYSSADLNSFQQNFPTATRARIWNKPYIFSATRVEYRKQRLLYNYRKRKMKPPGTFLGKLLTSHIFNWNFAWKPIYLSTTSLATLYHPPTFVVLTAPHVKRVDSRKAGPPAGLAIFGSESDMDKFIK